MGSGRGRGRGRGTGGGMGEDDGLCCCLDVPCWCCYILLWIFGLCLLVGGALLYGVRYNLSINRRQIYVDLAISMMAIGGALTVIALIMSIFVAIGKLNLTSFCEDKPEERPPPMMVPDTGKSSYMPPAREPVSSGYKPPSAIYEQPESPGYNQETNLDYPDQSYPSQAGAYPDQSYPSQAGSYADQGGYGGQGGYVDQQGGYSSQQAGYNAQQGGYSAQPGGFVAQTGGYGGSQQFDDGGFAAQPAAGGTNYSRPSYASQGSRGSSGQLAQPQAQ